MQEGDIHSYLHTFVLKACSCFPTNQPDIYLTHLFNNETKKLNLQGYGVYKYADKYGANVDGYSPIYTPDTWSESGDSYKLGTKGLIAWAGLIVVLLGVGINLVVSTSAIGQ
jgi:hypothetical protein